MHQTAEPIGIRIKVTTLASSTGEVRSVVQVGGNFLMRQQVTRQVCQRSSFLISTLVHKNDPGTRLHCPRACKSFITKNKFSLLDLMIKPLWPRESWIVDDTSITTPSEYNDSLALP